MKDQLFIVITYGGRRDSGETDVAVFFFKLDFTRNSTDECRRKLRGKPD